MSRSNVLLGLIAGREATQLLENKKLNARLAGAVDTPFGRSAPVYRCSLTGENDLIFMPRHSDCSSVAAASPVNYHANIYALKDLGCDAIVSCSGVRAISHNFQIGQFVLPEDLIDETRSSRETFFEHGPPAETRQWPTFCPALFGLLEQALARLGKHFTTGGTFLCNDRLRRETRAEVRKFSLWGAELLGDSLAPELFLARELQMCYACLCHVIEYAETGSEHRPFGMGSLFTDLDAGTDAERVKHAVDTIAQIVEQILLVIPTARRDCNCHKTFEELIASGQLPADFRAWFADKHGRSPTQPAGPLVR